MCGVCVTTTVLESRSLTLIQNKFLRQLVCCRLPQSFLTSIMENTISIFREEKGLFKIAKATGEKGEKWLIIALFLLG